MARNPAPILAIALALGACADSYIAPTDFERRGTWQADGVNDRNLRAMVADPSHMTRGVGAATERGDAGAAAVAAMQQGRRPALPQGITDIGQQGGGGGAGVTSGGGGGGR